MPSYNGTGPLGFGPGSGRGRGLCGREGGRNEYDRGRFCGRGIGFGNGGRGYGPGFGRRLASGKGRGRIPFFSSETDASEDRAEYANRLLAERRSFLMEELERLNVIMAKNKMSDSAETAVDGPRA